MKIPKTSVRTTWRTDWLVDFSVGVVALAILTREIVLAGVGAGILLALASLSLIFRRKLGILRKGLRVEQRLSKTTVLLGDSVEGELTVRNGSWLAAQILTIQPVVEKALSFRLASSSKQPLRPGSTSSLRFAIMPLARGRFQISGFVVTFTDARGLFTGEVKYAQTDWIEVYPGMGKQAPLTPLRVYGGNLGVLHKAATGTDYAGVREHALGDEYFRIEWKATARLRTLMVKEFHQETQPTMQILIDAGRTMHQQSYVGTKLDEALAVAHLLLESAIGSGNQVGIWVYNETEIVEVMRPATAEEQLARLRKFGLAIQAQAAGRFRATRVLLPQAPWSGASYWLHDERVTMFARSLKLGFGYRKTGVCKSLAEATKRGTEELSIVLTDLQRTMTLSLMPRRENVGFA